MIQNGIIKAIISDNFNKADEIIKQTNIDTVDNSSITLITYYEHWLNSTQITLRSNKKYVLVNTKKKKNLYRSNANQSKLITNNTLSTDLF